MPARYLLDTNIASYVIKGSSAGVRRRLKRHPMAEIAVSCVTEGELRYGLARHPEAVRLRALVDEFFLRVTILPWDSDAARQYDHLRSILERRGTVMGALDMMIGAHALAAGLTLVTNDKAFGRIAGLKLQDWTRP
jgi:tRNA(fMet)-specific endonuclease VapC